jgi:hypothetical protein
MKNFERLNKNEMKMIMGGVDESVGGTDGCFLRCDQNAEFGNTVADCSRATATAFCGDELANVVCVCSNQ